MSEPTTEELSMLVEQGEIDTTLPPEVQSQLYDVTRARLVREFHEIMLLSRLHGKIGDKETSESRKTQALTVLKMISALDEERASTSN